MTASATYLNQLIILKTIRLRVLLLPYIRRRRVEPTSLKCFDKRRSHAKDRMGRVPSHSQSGIISISVSQVGEMSTSMQRGIKEHIKRDGGGGGGAVDRRDQSLSAEDKAQASLTHQGKLRKVERYFIRMLSWMKAYTWREGGSESES